MALVSIRIMKKHLFFFFLSFPDYRDRIISSSDYYFTLFLKFSSFGCYLIQRGGKIVVLCGILFLDLIMERLQLGKKMFIKFEESE